jgi:FKBP-type peptidyl-prolyl cis-trans isomerase
MKKYALPLALMGLLGLQACNQQTSDTETAAESADAPLALETPAQRRSYALAYGMGFQLSMDDVSVDAAAFTAGIQDGESGAEPRMTQEELAAELTTFQQERAAREQEMMAEQQAAQAAAGEVNRAASEAFLAENATREGVTVTESGLQYEILEAGDGPRPGPEDTVEVHYRGTLVDGTEFDSSYGRGETVSFGVGQVIAGWTEALQLMSAGSKWKLAIPSELGYGAGGAGQMIGPDSALIFEVELVSIPSQAEEAPEG